MLELAIVLALQTRVLAHDDEIVAFRFRGEQIVTVERSGQARVWKPSGDLVKKFTVAKDVVCIALRERRLACAVGQRVGVYDLDSAKEPVWVETDAVQGSMGFADDRTLAVRRPDGGLRLVEWASGKVAAELAVGQDFVLSGDGRRVAGVGQGNIEVWDVRGRRRLQSIPGRRFDLRADGDRLVVIEGHTLFVRNATSAAVESKLSTGGVSVAEARWAGQRIVALMDGGGMRVWSDGLEVGTVEGGGAGFQCSADGRWLAWSDYDGTAKKRLVVCDLAAAMHPVLAGHRDAVTSLVARGGLVFSGSLDKSVRVWDAAQGRTLRSIDTGAPVLAVALSDDGKLVAVGGEDKLVRVYRDTGEFVRKHAACGPVASVAFQPGGGAMAAPAGEDGAVVVWQAATGDGIVDLVARAETVAWSADGKRLAATCRDGTLRVWSVGTWELETAIKARATGIPREPEPGFTCALFSGGLLVTGDRVGAGDAWSVTGWKHSARLTQGAGTVPTRAMALGPGRELALAVQDGHVLVYSLDAIAQPRVVGRHVGAALSVAFAPDGRAVLSGGEDALIRVRKLK